LLNARAGIDQRIKYTRFRVHGQGSGTLALRIEVHQQNPAIEQGQSMPKGYGGRRLPNTTLLIGNDDITAQGLATPDGLPRSIEQA
jgi:hypothetical protein